MRSTRRWRLLDEFVPDLHVHEHAFGAGCLASGHYRSLPADITSDLAVPVRIAVGYLKADGVRDALPPGLGVLRSGIAKPLRATY